MGTYCWISSLLLIYTLNVQCYVPVENITAVMDKYVLTCGFQLCNTSLSSYRRIVKQDFNVTVCPTCSCDLECLKRKDCCPDFYFLGPDITCISADVLNVGTRDTYKMISSCPTLTTDYLHMRCSGYNDSADLIENPPVTSKNITFRNDYCAECNNVSSTKPWYLDFSCTDFVDFNFLSTYKSIIEAGTEARCNITFTPDNIETEMCSDQNKNTPELIIDKCNTTGTWDLFDSDIELSCETIDSPFSLYKNVFCFMCNPPVADDRIVEKCNKTGKWFTDREGLMNACQNLPISSTSYPYKNSFCYLCNTPDNYTRFIDINSKQIIYGYQHSFRYTVETEQLNTEFLLKNEIEVYNIPLTYQLPAGKKTNANGAFDMENLLSYYNDYFFDETFCNNSISCSCQASCLFNESLLCCMEFLLRHNTTCLHTGQKTYLASTHCLYDNSIAARCHSGNTLFESLPFNILGKTYKNIYCYLCNEIVNMSTTIGNHSPWNIVIKCPSFIFVDFFLTLSDLYQYTIHKGCKASFELATEQVTDCKNRHYNYIHSCNWKETDEEFNKDVNWACQEMENPSIPTFYYFKNVFCSFCYLNPTGTTSQRTTPFFSTTPIIRTTNPRTITFTPATTYRTTPPVTPCWFYCDVSFSNVKTFRSIFAVRSYRHILPDIHRQTVIASCPVGKIYDNIQKRCRSLMCYPGRILRNETCVPLLEITSNLGYILRLKIDTEISNYKSSVLSLLQDTKLWIVDFIKNYLGLSYISSPSVSMFINMACKDYFEKNETLNITMYISLKVFINETVNRSYVEDNLLSLHQREFNVIEDEASISFKLSKDKQSNDIEYMIEFVDHYQTCVYISREEIDYSPYRSYRFVPASILLLCSQVQMDSKQYIVNWARQQVSFPKYSFSVDFGRYLIEGQGKIRICKSDFKANIKKNQFESGWTVMLNNIMRIFSIVSLVSLFLTFLSYLIFPMLQTLPGKNNMCLVFALFWTLLLFTFGLEYTENEFMCKMFGILLHYFWLASFGCLNVCSFHMFRTFRNMHVPNSNRYSERKRLLKYIAYSYGLPLIIVGINIGITSGVTESRSIGYGDIMCFLTFIYAVWSTFLIPVSLVCLSNAIMFTVTFYKIKTLPKVHNDSHVKQNKVHTAMYFKLFSLTGITWVLQLIEAFLPMSIFTFIISILNSLQGVFIFISYVCNYRVFNLYSEKCCSTKKKESSFSDVTEMS